MSLLDESTRIVEGCRARVKKGYSHAGAEGEVGPIDGKGFTEIAIFMDSSDVKPTKYQIHKSCLERIS